MRAHQASVQAEYSIGGCYPVRLCCQCLARLLLLYHEQLCWAAHKRGRQACPHCSSCKATPSMTHKTWTETALNVCALQSLHRSQRIILRSMSALMSDSASLSAVSDRPTYQFGLIARRDSPVCPRATYVLQTAYPRKHTRVCI
jgi:hypothetical protein